MKSSFLGLLLCCCITQMFGQQVVFNVQPKGAFVRINGEVLDLNKQTTVTIPPGTYEAEIWAPNFEIARKTVVVEEGRTVVVNHGMKTTSAAYRKFVDERSIYNTAKLKRTLTGGSLVAVTVAGSYVALTGRGNKLDKIEALISNREQAYLSEINPIEIEQAGNQYSIAVDDYEETQASHNTLVVVGVASAVAGAAATVLYFIKRKPSRLIKPSVMEDNPFTFHPRRSVAYLTSGTSFSPIGFTLNF
ncbi:hypothetical protein FUA23_09760 [Neolewinella aurantiaca]|uniref:PEGA domain-containing protein n=1 Tax=Neolewinella aurantiaca TaxID=2602767 RepID=A0A5C7FH39_9BACT|nr:PEGA domain-containing protein [Neolewinella aurantiaca]TXF89724.1 hypothetical protein FUA23_09760 [Neolewinella aurantiaca]